MDKLIDLLCEKGLRAPPWSDVNVHGNSDQYWRKFVSIDVTNIALHMQQTHSGRVFSPHNLTNMTPPLPSTIIETSIRTTSGLVVNTLDLANYLPHEREDVVDQFLDSHQVAPTLSNEAEANFDHWVQRARWVVVAFAMQNSPIGPIGPLYLTVFMLDRNGELVAYPDRKSPGSAAYMMDNLCPPGSNMSDVVMELRQYLDALLFTTLEFMGCKNVAQHKNTPRQTKKRRKQNKPPRSEYYVLEIGRGTKTVASETVDNPDKLARRLHVCRGHFATYTPEKPLFGKLAGKFWIPAHTRGQETLGTIQKDYALKGA